MLGKAISIASKSFEKIKDKGGRPYILHCLWVMDRVRHLGDEYMIVAVLHDLVEDTDWTIQMLREEGFSERILHSIDILTKKDDVPYKEYITLVKINAIAREVKLRDLEHNSKITRLKGVTDNDLKRAEKYHKSYIYLKD